MFVDAPAAKALLLPAGVTQLRATEQCGNQAYQASLVCEGAEAANKNVPSYALSEDLNTQNISHDLLCFLQQSFSLQCRGIVEAGRLYPLKCKYLVNIRVHKGDIVVACYAVSKRRQALVYSLDHHLIWKTVSDVLQLCKGSFTFNYAASYTANVVIDVLYLDLTLN